MARILALGCMLAMLAGRPVVAEPSITDGAAGPDAKPAADQRPASPVFIPRFWDPDAVAERPKLDDIPTIRFVTVDDYPPFGLTLADGTLAGFNVDLARAICDELRLGCTIQTRRFETIIPALKVGAADAAIASMAITETTLGNVDFTMPYYKTPARFVTRVGGATAAVRPETIGSRVVGVVDPSAHAAYLRAAFPAARLHGFSSPAALRTALADSTVELAFGDGIGWAPWLASPESRACCVMVDGAFTESRFFGEGAGIAVKKGNAALRRALDYALARIAAKGRYAEIYLKYFPIGIY